MLLCAPDSGAPRGCHVAPFPPPLLKAVFEASAVLRVMSPVGPEGGLSVGPLRVSEEGFPRVL